MPQIMWCLGHTSTKMSVCLKFKFNTILCVCFGNTIEGHSELPIQYLPGLPAGVEEPSRWEWAVGRRQD